MMVAKVIEELVEVQLVKELEKNGLQRQPLDINQMLQVQLKPKI